MNSLQLLGQNAEKGILTFELHEAILILGLAELVHQNLRLLLGQLLSQVGEQLEEVVALDRVVRVLVVQLQDLHEVVEAALGLVLGGLEDWVERVQGDILLALLLHATVGLGDGRQGGVHVAGTEDVSGVEGVDGAVSLEVIDVEGEVHG